MKIVDCIWEQANLGCRVAEVSIGATDPFPTEELLDLESKFDYIVLKFEVGNFLHYQAAADNRYAFIETQLSIKKKMADFKLSPKEEKILSLYACGMSQRDIAEQIKELYDVEISPELVTKISEKIIEVFSVD